MTDQRAAVWFARKSKSPPQSSCQVELVGINTVIKEGLHVTQYRPGGVMGAARASASKANIVSVPRMFLLLTLASLFLCVVTSTRRLRSIRTAGSDEPAFDGSDFGAALGCDAHVVGRGTRSGQTARRSDDLPGEVRADAWYTLPPPVLHLQAASMLSKYFARRLLPPRASPPPSKSASVRLSVGVRSQASAGKGGS